MFRKSVVFPILAAVVLAGTLPLLIFPDLIPCKDDVDYELATFEAIRRSILEYGEFPYWNPWWHGGVPLYANPNASVFSVETLCVLPAGTFYGLKLAVSLYSELAAFGMYFLLGDYTANRFARFYGAVMFALAGCFSVHVVNGHYVFLGFALLPWILWLLHRIGRKWTYAMFLGAAAGTVLNHDSHYTALFILLTAAVMAVPQFLKHWREPDFLRKIMIAGCSAFAVGGYRMLVSLSFQREYPRIMIERFFIPWDHILEAFVVPFHEMITSFAGWLDCTPPFVVWGWHELGCYVGGIAVAFAVASLFPKIRWFHWAILFTGMIAFNTSARYLPGYWMREIPPFTSCFVFVRWRFVLLLFLCVATASGYAHLHRGAGPGTRKILFLLAVVSMGFLIANNLYIYTRAVPGITERELLQFEPPRPAGTDFMTVVRPGDKLYAGVRNNIGNLAGYEPTLGYGHEAAFGHFPIGEADYSGEFVSNCAERTSWSPNRIEFSAKGPGKVRINANPGSYWRINGQILFPTARSFEESDVFEFSVPSAGKYVLTALPRIHETALYFSLCSTLAALLLILYEIKKGRDPSSGRGPWKNRTEKTQP